MIATKILLRELSPTDILFWRFVIGYITLWVFFPRKMKIHDKKHEVLFCICGITGVNLYFFLQNTALEITRASDVSIIISVIPMITAILNYLVYKDEKLNKNFAYGFIVAIVGVVLVCRNGAQEETSILGDFLTVLAGISWGIYCIVGKKITSYGYSPFLCIRRYFFYGLISMLPFVIWNGIPNMDVLIKPNNMLSILYMGVGASALAYVFWNYSSEKIGVLRTNIYLYLIPVFTIAISSMVLNEKVTGQVVIGATLTIFGMLLSEKTRRNKDDE